ncbi:metal ABC transporter solute-binding protein, Zn/Mn family [Reyranella sp. CPCC 100927]|uniref:metal ABC transporter solute-binding protein, Zn/Mn family n=1 Tax=Reyranella sp. CPCC 100927 TaxID=2599616 RepID=UPI0011B7F48B|nr:zinc ABC transporter substrate-binding protein [Reyranella sp. CPCC 100927]TWT11432.1 metal ABC transporter substrate-binding protein [Reyranella sp. CPCC 100927]
MSYRVRVGRRVVLAAGVALLASTPAVAQQRLKVVASFSIIGDMVREIGGDRIEVATVVGADQDAHTYQPTPSDAKAVAAAKVLFVNGLGFEGWIDRLARAAPFKGTRVVLTDGIANPLTLESGGSHGGHKHAHGASDPHTWQDITNARLYARNIVKGLAAADPANAEAYRQRGADYDRRLGELDAWVKSQIATVPADKRKVITGHEAFRYFARAYGVAFHAPIGVSTDQEPSAQQIAGLIRLMKSTGIKAIFIENMSNPKLVEQIARDAGGVVGPALYSDALSKPGGPADTYEKLFRFNVQALVAGMQKN